MPKTKPGIVNFYQIVDEGGSKVDLKEIAGQIVAIPDPRDRHQAIGGYTMRMEAMLFSRNGLSFEMVKIRTDDLPSHVGPDGQLTEFHYTGGGGLGEHSCFLLHSANNVVAVLKSGYGPAINNIVEYLQRYVPGGVRLALQQVMTLDAMERLHRLDEVRRLALRVARPHNLEGLQGTSAEIDNVLRWLRTLGGESLKVELTMGRKKKGSLNVGPAIRMAQEILLGLGEENVEVLQLKGKDEEGSPDDVDLITDRLYVKVQLDFDEDRKRVVRETRHQALDEAFDKHADFLKRL